MVRQLIKFLDPLDVSANYGLLFLEHPDIAIHLDVSKLLIKEISEGGRHLIFTFVVE